MNEPTNMRSIMERYGHQVRLCLPDSESEPFSAFLQPLRYKTKTYLGGVNTRIGFNREGHYLYLGPPEHDLTKSDLKQAWIQEEGSGQRYSVDRAEMVHIGDEPSHAWAIIRAVET